MIVRDHLPWVRVWPHISKKLGALLIFDTTIAFLYVFAGASFLAVSSLPLSMVGAALSIFIAFRTKSAYDRWWEARMLWGALVNSSRSLARQAVTLITPSDAETGWELQRRLVIFQISYVHALRCHLRNQNPYPELRKYLDTDTLKSLRSHSNVPAALLLHMGQLLRDAHALGWLDSYRWAAIDRTLTALTDIQGG